MSVITQKSDNICSPWLTGNQKMIDKMSDEIIKGSVLTQNSDRICFQPFVMITKHERDHAKTRQYLHRVKCHMSVITQKIDRI